MKLSKFHCGGCGGVCPDLDPGYCPECKVVIIGCDCEDAGSEPCPASTLRRRGEASTSRHPFLESTCAVEIPDAITQLEIALTLLRGIKSGDEAALRAQPHLDAAVRGVQKIIALRGMTRELDDSLEELSEKVETLKARNAELETLLHGETAVAETESTPADDALGVGE